MPPVQTRHPGQALTIKASEWNAIAGVVNAATMPRDQRQGAIDTALAPGQVWVRNSTGDDVARYDVLKIAGTLTPVADLADRLPGSIGLAGESVDESDLPPGRFVVALESIRDGAMGRAALSGVWPIRATVLDADHRYLRTLDGQAQLRSCSSGLIRILSAEAGVGDRGVIACINPCAGPLTIRAQITGATPIDGEHHRWEYDWTEIVRTGAEFVAGERMSGDDGPAYNLSELGHAETGLLGSGVDLAHVPANWAPVPIGPAGVRLTRGDDGTWEFEGLNQIDGECPEPEEPA